MPDVKRNVKIITEQKIVDATSDPPLRKWTIEIVLLGSHGEQLPANIFEKAVYKLHETFGERQTQTFKRAPFKIAEEGWGEFDMVITLSAIDKGGDFPLMHDLNFQSEHYEAKHSIVFKNPKPGLLEKLRDSGSVPGESNGVKGRDESAKKKKRPDKGIDMDRLAENLQKMTEDDLLTVVQLIHDNKTSETVTKNDIEQGEFHVDLYTLPDSLIRQLWDFSSKQLGL